MLISKDYAKEPDSLLRECRALWVVDRAFVDMPFWDAQYKRYRQTVIIRMKDNFTIEAQETRPFADFTQIAQ